MVRMNITSANKQLTKLPFSIAGKKVGMIFNDKYDKIWFQEGNEALTYYDPLNKSNHRFPFPKQNAIGTLKSRMPVNRVCFSSPPGGENSALR